MKKNGQYWLTYWSIFAWMLLPPLAAIILLLVVDDLLLKGSRSILGMSPLWEVRMAGLLFMVLLAIYYGILAKKMALPFTQLLRCGRALSQGDYSQRVTVNTSNDLLEQINILFNDSCEVIQTTAEQIIPVMQQVEAALEEEKGKLLPMNTSVRNQMQICQTSLDASRTAHLKMHVTAEHVFAAQELLDRIRDSILTARREMQNLRMAARRLQEASTEANSIIKNSEDISFQTHILSILANVESVSNQTEGNGDAFEVLAQEIKLLANESSQAALDTKAQIAAISEAVDTGVQAVLKAAEAMDATGEHIMGVHEHMGQLHHRMKDEEGVAAAANKMLQDMYGELVQNQENLRILTRSNVSILKEMRELRNTCVILKGVNRLQSCGEDATADT